MANVTIVGAGFVGLANGLVLSIDHEIKMLDIDPAKVKLAQREGLDSSIDKEWAYKDAEYVIVSVPTDDTEEGLDTSIVRQVVSEIPATAKVIIKSTIPVGFCDTLDREVAFCPEFLRERTAYYDCMRPDRIIVTAPYVEKLFSPSCPVVRCTNREAEAIKLFSNTYLAMRVAFFNEVDSFCEDSSKVIKGICLDHRIGDYYNTPSEGYGGYCLPKDTRQMTLQAGTPLISAIEVSNEKRKKNEL